MTCPSPLSTANWRSLRSSGSVRAAWGPLAESKQGHSVAGAAGSVTSTARAAGPPGSQRLKMFYRETQSNVSPLSL